MPVSIEKVPRKYWLGIAEWIASIRYRSGWQKETIKCPWAPTRMMWAGQVKMKLKVRGEGVEGIRSMHLEHIFDNHMRYDGDVREAVWVANATRKSRSDTVRNGTRRSLTLVN